ncbi:VOC family protein [Streptomyces sp. NPDC059740]|uniref:VOC family protein n=1 Tax=Streptomyces sp. NPDC059740 TaxID=3346926 RepID=UPI00365469BB
MLTTPYVSGSPSWADLSAPDVDAAAAFYGTVLGWEFRSAGPGAGGYGFFELGGRIVAAVAPLTEEGAPAAWTLYFQCEDADATAAAVTRAGGTVRSAPRDVFTAGRTAALTDPTGARFAVWQPGDRKGLDVVAEPGALTWVELYTTDAPAARDFYHEVFAWEVRQTPVGDFSAYFVASPAGSTAEKAHAGLLQLQQEHLDHGSRSEWHPYFATTDCDASVGRATQAGATVIIPPMEAPGIGRLAMLLDPSQATFALLTPAAG